MRFNTLRFSHPRPGMEIPVFNKKPFYRIVSHPPGAFKPELNSQVPYYHKVGSYPVASSSQGYNDTFSGTTHNALFRSYNIFDKSVKMPGYLIIKKMSFYASLGLFSSNVITTNYGFKEAIL